MYIVLKELLKERGRTKYWLANKIEASHQSMTKLINNETNNIYFVTIDKICDALDCEPKDFIKREKKNE